METAGHGRVGARHECWDRTPSRTTSREQCRTQGRAERGRAQHTKAQQGTARHSTQKPSRAQHSTQKHGRAGTAHTGTTQQCIADNGRAGQKVSQDNIQCAEAGQDD